MGLYILDESGEKPVRCVSLERWAHWFEDFQRRRVGATYLDHGKTFISTVFLGVDHGSDENVPILWETMVFCGASGEREMDRCGGTREQALAMHAAMVERIEAVLALDEGIPLKA